MSKLFEADIRRIREASLNGKLAIFVGPRVSSESGVPTPRQVIKKLQKELSIESLQADNDGPKIAQIYKDSRAHKEYMAALREAFKYGTASSNPIHEITFGLDPAHVITTNLDGLLEQAISRNNFPYYKITKDSDLKDSTYNKFIIKMHGDLGEGNVVLTEDDYLDYEANFSLTSAFIRSLWTSKLILFIGYSLEDHDLNAILHIAKALPGKNFQDMYLLNPGQTDQLQKQYYRAKGLKMIDYHDLIDHTPHPVYSKKEIRDLNELSSPEGKRLYKFLLFIQKFDAFEAEQSQKHIIDILYNAIHYYFDELRVVGGREILHFYPFNREPEASYAHFVLRTNNQAITDLRNALKGNFQAKKTFLRQYGQKYREVVWFARLNGIERLDKPEREAGPNTGFKLPAMGRNQRRSGLDHLCELNFKELGKRIVELKSCSGDEASMDRLELPFLLYKVGAYYDSCVAFRDLARTCWANEKYLLYFICQMNIRNISPLLSHEFLLSGTPIEFDAVQKIQKQARDINLDDIIRRIYTKSKVLHGVLQRIYDFRYTYKIFNSADGLMYEIQKSLEHSGRGGHSLNSNVQSLAERACQLWSFTNYNYIAAEHYEPNLFVYRKAFEGFILSNNRPEIEHGPVKTVPRLEELEPRHVIPALTGLEFRFIERIFRMNRIYRLEFSKAGLDKICTMAMNAVESFHGTGNDNKVLSHLKSRSIQNLLFILSRLRLDEEFCAQIIRKVIQQKSIELELMERPLEYFVNSPHNSFDTELLSGLLTECFLRHDGKNIPVNLVFTLLSKIDPEGEEYAIRDERILYRLLHPEFMGERRLCSLLIPLYPKFPKSVQKQIVNSVTRELNQEFRIEMFRLAFDNGLPLKTEYTVQFVDEVEEYFKGKGRRANEQPILLTMYAVFNQSGDPDLTQRVEALSKKVPFLDFLMHGADYSKYDSFELDWLQFVPENYYKILSGKKVINNMIQARLKQLSPPAWLLDVYFKYFCK